jgi:putative hydrolase of the HAD superfamily
VEEDLLMNRIHAVFFDAAGTLFHVKGSVAEIYLRYAEKYGVKRTDHLQAAINGAFMRAFQEAPPPVFAATEAEALKECERLWWFDIVHHVFYRVGMFEGFDEYFDEVFEAFAGPQCWSLYPETLEALKMLRANGLELGIVSNFDSRLFSVLRGLGLSELFDTVTISSLAKAAKPAPRIFQVALEKHGLDPREAVHVGDNLHDDLEGARQAGLCAVLMDRDGRSGGHHALGTDERVIRQLTELPSVVREFEHGSCPG